LNCKLPHYIHTWRQTIFLPFGDEFFKIALMNPTFVEFYGIVLTDKTIKRTSI
jgi:hypothetical protein